MTKLSKKSSIIISVIALFLVVVVIMTTFFLKKSNGDSLTKALNNAQAVAALNLKNEFLSGDTTAFNLLTNGRDNLLGVDGNPIFTWNMNSTARGECQIAYAVGVATTAEKAAAGDYDVWYSGIFAGNTMNLTYGDTDGVNATTPAELKPQTKYYWNVLLYNKDGYKVPLSECECFETGLQGDFGVDNKWIEAKTPENPVDDTDLTMASSLFRKQFTLNQSVENVESARLYATAAGCHIMYLNGERAGNDYMAPGKSSPTVYLYYQTYDIADKLVNGDNTVAAEVGGGWLNSGAVFSQYGENTGLKAKLVINFKDGSTQVINTDGTWLGTKEGHTTSNQYYAGQTINATRKINGWNCNNSASSKWLEVSATDTFVVNSSYYGKSTMSNTFIAELSEPVTVTEILHPVSVRKSENGYIYALNQNIAGTLRITATAPKGTKITINYNESDNENIDSYLGHNGTDTYVFAGTGNETFEFDLVYHGFQYIIIKGLDTTIPLENIQALVLSTCNESTLTFQSSNELMNKLVSNTDWSIKGNFVSTITDCPTREKNTWTGDAQLIATTSTYFYNTYNIYDNFQRMSRYSQYADGSFQALIPSMKNNNENMSTGSSSQGWCDSIITIPYNMYKAYGLKNVITDNYDSMKKYMDYVIKSDTYNISDESADNYYLRRGHCWGDHLAYYNYKNNKKKGQQSYYIKDEDYGQVMRETHYEDIATAYASYMSRIMADFATQLGKTDDAAYYSDVAEKYAAAWRKNWLEEDGITTKSNSQTSYALGLEYNLYEPEKRAAAAQKLADIIKEDDYLLSVGFMGIDIVLPALSNNGQAETAFKLYLSENEKCSLYNTVKKGATTIWESPSGGSLNHYAYGASSRWVIENVLGISQSADTDCTNFVIAPTYSTETGVTTANGTYTSAVGNITSEWALSSDGKTFTFNCKIPANATAVIAIPITDESNTITENGINAKNAEGLEFVKYENGRAYFNAVSGTYNFTVNY